MSVGLSIAMAMWSHDLLECVRPDVLAQPPRQGREGEGEGERAVHPHREGGRVVCVYLEN